jgi:hypothetical protein
MKTSKNDSAIEWIVKKIGGAIVFKERKKRKFRATEEQAKNQKRFTAASRYARMQMEDPEKKAMYEKRKNGKYTSGYTVALADCLKAPEVLDIKTSAYYGAAGDVIEIHATDDFKVIRVRVIIRNDHNEVIEEGDATESYRDHWEYVAKAVNRCLANTTITAIAYDYPQNSGRLEKRCENSCHIASTKNKKVPKVKSPRRVSKILNPIAIGSRNHGIIK